LLRNLGLFGLIPVGNLAVSPPSGEENTSSEHNSHQQGADSKQPRHTCAFASF
jgi:hypothetical protein